MLVDVSNYCPASPLSIPFRSTPSFFSSFFLSPRIRWRSETFVWFVQELDGSVSKVQRLTEWRHRSTHAWQRGVLQRHLEKWRAYQCDLRRESYIWGMEGALQRVVVSAWRKRSAFLVKRRARAAVMGRGARMKDVLRTWGRLTDERIICRQIIERMVHMFRCTTIAKGFAIWQRVVDDYFRSKDLVLQFVLRMNNVKMTQGFLQWKHHSIVATQRIQADLAHLSYFQKMQARKSSSRRVSTAFHKWKRMAQTSDWQQGFIYKYVHKGTMRRRLLQWRRNTTLHLRSTFEAVVAERNTLKRMLLIRTLRRMVRKAFGGSFGVWRHMTRMKRRVHIMFARVVNLHLSLALGKWQEACGDMKKRVAQLVATYGQRLQGSALCQWRESIHRADQAKAKILRILFRKMRGGFLRWKAKHSSNVKTRWQYNWLRSCVTRMCKVRQGESFRRWRRTAEKMSLIREHALEQRIVLGELLNLRQHAQATNLIKSLLHNIQHPCKDSFNHWRVHCVSMVQKARACVYRWVGKLEQQRLRARWLHWSNFTYACRKATAAAVVARVLPTFRKALTWDAWERFSAAQKVHRMVRLFSKRAEAALVDQGFCSWNALAADHSFVDERLSRAASLLERWALRRALEKARRDTGLYKALRGAATHAYRRIVASAVVAWQRAVIADCLRDHDGTERFLQSSMLAAAKEKRFAKWSELASEARRKRRVLNKVLIFVRGGAVGVSFRCWKKLFKAKRSWEFLVATWMRGTPVLNFQRWRKHIESIKHIEKLVRSALRLGHWKSIGAAMEKWKEVVDRHARVRVILLKTLRLKTAQAFAQLHRGIYKRYWKLQMCSRNFENHLRYRFLHKTRVSFGYWVHRTRLVRMAATRLISSSSAGRRVKVLSAFQKIRHSANTFRGAKSLVARTIRHMVRTTLIMGLSQWKRAVTLRNAQRIQILRFIMTKMRHLMVSGMSRWMRSTKHMTLNMTNMLHQTNQFESRQSFARYRAKIVAAIVKRREREDARTVIDSWHRSASISRHLKNWLARAVNYKVTVVLKAALRTWRTMSMNEAYNELGFQAARDRRELANLRAEVGEVRGQKQQVSDQLNYSMHVLEYVMANQ